MTRKLPISVPLIISAICLSTLTGCAAFRSKNQNIIRFEHVAINVEDPIAMAKWYVENLGMKVLRKGPAPVNMTFIADARENMMFELYHNPPDKVPDYRKMEPLSLHFAFVVDDVPAVSRKLLAAGATVHTETFTTDAGDVITILRDPWGLSIQFITRAKPMLK